MVRLNRVVSIDAEEQVAVAEPGTVLDSITAAAAPHGLRFGPDPSTHSRATIGGAIGNNACGSRALRYGRTADNVIALDVVTGSGERFTARRLGRDARPAGAGTPGAPGMSAPCSSSSTARANARSGSRYLPPSENESGVTFNTPISNVRSPSSSSRPASFQTKCRRVHG